MFKPKKVPPQVTMMGATSSDLARYYLIPKEGRLTQTGPLEKYEEFTEDVFFKGSNNETFDRLFQIREGVDKTLAMAHFAAVLRSFDLGHNKKITLAASLLREWFDLK